MCTHLGQGKRDYKYLTDSEASEWKALKLKEKEGFRGSTSFKRSLFHEYPKAVRHHIHLFPNHYLDIMELEDTNTLKNNINKFKFLLAKTDLSEREILNFINANEHFFLIGAVLKTYFNFGHHEAHVFREFPLGTSFKADYLILGKNSDGWHFVFVELEAPIGNITIKDGNLGSTFRKGLDQIQDWDHWLEKNFQSLQEYFLRHKQLNIDLPEELYHLDKSRINYVVVAGRRTDFSDKTYRIKRIKQRNDQIYLLHYDNIVDASEELIESSTY